MQKYSFDLDNPESSSSENIQNQKLTLDVLKNKLAEMSIMADIESPSPYRAIVRVQKHVGTTMFLATESNDTFWLYNNAVKKEDKGSVTVFHFVFD